MIDPELAWLASDRDQRLAYRSRNSIGTGTVTLVDDTYPAQSFQVMGYPTELRGGVVRAQAPGFSSVPLVGAKVVTLYHGGDRANAIIVGAEDVRYRPTGLSPGEFMLYVVDGASASAGAGGTTRPILRGLLGWLTSLFGKVINIGDANTQTINVVASTQINLTAPKIILNGEVHLGGEGGKPAAIQGTVDSDGDTLQSGFATKVLMQ